MPGPAWAPTGRGGSVAAHRRGEAGGSLPARGGRERTCPVSPQAPRALSASPPPQPGHGKEGRGGGRGERTLGFPQPPGGGTGTRGVPPAAFSARRGLLFPLGKRKLRPTRVAPTWGLLASTDPVLSLSLGFRRLPGLRHPLPRPGEGRSPLTPGWLGGSAPPASAPAARGHLPTPASPLPCLLPNDPGFWVSRRRLASSPGLRLPARELFYGPKQNIRDTSGLGFRTLSAPLPATASPSQFTCPVQPHRAAQTALPGVRLAPSGVEPPGTLAGRSRVPIPRSRISSLHLPG